MPEPIIRRRFDSSLRNLFRIYRPLLDAWWLYDASRLPPVVVAREEQGRMILFDSKIYEEIKRKAEV